MTGQNESGVELMWDTPFDESMLSLKQGVVIHCPDENLAEELFEIFKRNGVGKNWEHEEWTTHWEKYKEETAYFVKDEDMLYGQKVHAEQVGYKYAKYKKCTFLGIDTPDFETASDAELRNFLGIGGV